MPIAYRLRQDPPLILSCYVGLVTEDEYLRTYRAIFTNPEYRPGMHELADTRGMTAFDVRLPAIRSLAEWVAARITEPDDLMRTAVIQGNEANTAVSRLYGAVADLHQKEALQLFPTVDAAAEWLDLDPSEIPVIESELDRMKGG